MHFSSTITLPRRTLTVHALSIELVTHGKVVKHALHVRVQHTVGYKIA